jgi:hypothetical protein
MFGIFLVLSALICLIYRLHYLPHRNLSIHKQIRNLGTELLNNKITQEEYYTQVEILNNKLKNLS